MQKYSSTSSLKSCLSLPLGESSQSPFTLLDPIEEAEIAIKLNIILALLDNMIQFFDTPNQKMKSGSPTSKQLTTAHPSVQPYARRDLQSTIDQKIIVSRPPPHTQPHRSSNFSHPPRNDVKEERRNR